MTQTMTRPDPFLTWLFTGGAWSEVEHLVTVETPCAASGLPYEQITQHSWQDGQHIYRCPEYGCHFSAARIGEMFPPHLTLTTQQWQNEVRAAVEAHSRRMLGAVA